MSEDEEIKHMLATSRVIAVVGLSPKMHRASYDVATYMQKAGYRIIPINPSHAGKNILDEICHRSLEEAAQMLAKDNQTIDIVDCFRKSEDIVPIAQSAIAIHAACLWMQLGIQNQEAAMLAKRADMQVVMNKCLKIEHRKCGKLVR